MEREDPTVQIKGMSQEKTTTAPTAIQEQQAATKSPQAFYAKMLERSDVREILTRFATMDTPEMR